MQSGLQVTNNRKAEAALKADTNDIDTDQLVLRDRGLSRLNRHYASLNIVNVFNQSACLGYFLVRWQLHLDLNLTLFKTFKDLE